MHRRDFIKASSLIGGGLLLNLGFAAKAAAGTKTSEAIHAMNVLVKLDTNGKVLFQLGQHEMGQQVSNALAMVLAEEMGADWEKIDIVFAKVQPAFKEWGGHVTGGSTSMVKMYPVVRKAGSTARYLLTQAAARKWNTTADHCLVENSKVTHKTTGKTFSFGELATEAAQIPLPATDTPLQASLKPAIIGQPKASKHIPNLVTGQYTYGMDVEVKGMLYGVILRSPVFKGKVRSFDSSKALQIAGVKQVFAITPLSANSGDPVYKEGIAVLADSMWAAIKGRQALEVSWEDGELADFNDAKLDKLASEQLSKESEPNQFLKGNANAIKESARTVEASYIYPYQAHVTMEPLNCVAHHKGDSYALWIGTQFPEGILRQAETHFTIPPEKAEIHLFPSGGSFGRRFYQDIPLEALMLSKQAGNIPVKLVWTREDDVQHDYFHFYSQTRMQAGINANNVVEALYVKDSRCGFGAEQMWNGYNMANIREDFIALPKVLQPGAWRSVVNNGWGFALESFIDELAYELKTDPLAFRLNYLSPAREVENKNAKFKLDTGRLMKVLQTAAQIAGWEKKKQKNTALGLSAYPYLHANSYCAQVAEVAVIDKQIKIRKIICVVDCGKVINPVFARQQMEGGIIWSLSALLHGPITVEKGRVQQSNFHNYQILRQAECPQIEVHFVESGNEPGGAGEVSVPGTIPAVCNALFKLTGKRIRRLPVNLETLLS